MTEVPPGVWTRLDPSRCVGESLLARRITPDAVPSLLAAVDRLGKRHLLLAMSTEDPEISDRHSRGVRLETRVLDVHEHESGRYLDLACIDDRGHQVFDIIASEISDGLAAGILPIGDLVRQVLGRWRRFWGQAPQVLLSREHQIGLFGELWFMHVWLRPRTSARTAVSAWTGPLRARHDFNWSGLGIEVKTITSQSRSACRIHGVDQLDNPDSGLLKLFTLRVREDPGASNSLPKLVSTVAESVEADPEAAEEFARRLTAAGYDESHRLEYEQLHLTTVDERLYRVEGDFPRIIGSTFTHGVPSGVEVIDYEISLAGLDHLVECRSAASWVPTVL